MWNFAFVAKAARAAARLGAGLLVLASLLSPLATPVQAAPIGSARVGMLRAVDPDATRWAAAVYANGGTVSGTYLRAISAYIAAEKKTGVWQKRDDYWMLRAENSVQALTSLKRRVLATAVSAPLFAPYNGFKFNGSTNYIRTAFVPTTNSRAMTLNDLEISVWESTDLPSASYAMGASSSGIIAIDPRSGGGAYAGNANTGSVSIAGAPTSIGLTSVYQGQGVTFGVDKNGAFVGSAAATALLALPGVEYYIGALNNGGAAANFRGTMVSFAATGASLTVAQEAAAYANLLNLFNALPKPDVYISASGNDTTGIGTAAAPVKTWDVGYALAASGARILLDGTAGAPTVYQSATTTTIDKSITVQAINAGGAILAGGSGTTQAALIGASGIAVTLNNVILDPSLNTGGAALRCAVLQSTAATFSLALNGTTCRNWRDYGIYSGGPTRVALVGASLTLTGGAVQSAMYLPNLVGGSSLAINGGSCTITAKISMGFGCLHLTGGDATVTATFTNFNCAITLDATQTSTGIDYCVRDTDIPLQWNHNAGGCSGTSTFTSSAPAGTRQTHLLALTGISYGVSGSNICNIAWTNGGNGGIGALIGGDSPLSSRALNSNIVVDNFSPVGTSNAAVEGFVAGSTDHVTLQNTSMINPGITCMCGAKDSTYFKLLNDTFTNVKSLPTLDKGNQNSVWDTVRVTFTDPSITSATGFTVENNVDFRRTITGITQANPATVTVSASASYHVGDPVYLTGAGGMTQVNGQRYQIASIIDATHYTLNVDSSGFSAYTSGGSMTVPSTGISIVNSSVTVAGSTGIVATNLNAGNTFAPSGNTYTLSSGGYAANAFQIAGTNETDCVHYKPVFEPTATCVGF